MKNRTRLAILGIVLSLAVALTARAEISLRSVYYYPAEQRLSLYVSEDGFSRAVEVPMSGLTTEQQAGVSAALDWLTLQLPAGVADISLVILEPGALSETGARSLDASVAALGPKGRQTLAISGGDAPEPVRAGLLAIWDALEGGVGE